MEVKGFAKKEEALAFSRQNDGVVLWDEWSQKRGAHTQRGKEYQKTIRAAGLNPVHNRYIVLTKGAKA